MYHKNRNFIVSVRKLLLISITINYSICENANNSLQINSTELTAIGPVFRFYRNKIVYTDITLSGIDVNFLLKHLANYNRVIFITHGFRGSVDKQWMHTLKNAVFDEHARHAVIIIGWGNGAMFGTFPSYSKYLKSAKNIEIVANWLSNYVKQIKQFYPNLKLWAIGHSLGAHLMGQTGRLSKAFSRITGLDPAGPSFLNGEQNQQNRLKQTDAEIVDVIHTFAYKTERSLSLLRRIFSSNSYPFGNSIPLGTVDFYPNYGHTQPGCGSSQRCNHNRAIELFVWSVYNRGKFKTNKTLKLNGDYANPVNEYYLSNMTVEMGFYFDNSPAVGDYYITTNENEPWI